MKIVSAGEPGVAGAGWKNEKVAGGFELLFSPASRRRLETGAGDKPAPKLVEKNFFVNITCTHVDEAILTDRHPPGST